MTYKAKSKAELLRVQNMLCKLRIPWVADYEELTVTTEKGDS